MSALRDHPRMRGEHRLANSLLMHKIGIIPACAGSTRKHGTRKPLQRGSSPHARGAPQARGRAASRSWDHPRMRGEHDAQALAESGLTGIIPACAGSTLTLCDVMVFARGSSPHARGAPTAPSRAFAVRLDHPRMRGEHRVPVEHLRARVGIIPACAGSTCMSPSTTAACMGSSPHARGARIRRCC